MSFKVLIVDDDSNKIGLMKKAVLDSEMVEDDNVKYCLELQEAMKLLSQDRYDLVLLDIMLPGKMGDQKIRSGGISLLQGIKRMIKLKKPLCVIGVTAHDDLMNECESEFSQGLFSLIKYESSSAEWRNQITEKVKWLVQAKQELLKEDRSIRKYRFDVAIVTAVPNEHKAVLDLPLDWIEYRVPFDDTIYHIAESNISGKKVRLVLAKQKLMGMPAAATTTTKLINCFNPRYVVMLGITGGRAGEVELCDLIVATTGFDYGSGKWKGKDGMPCFLPDPDHISISSELRTKLEKDYSHVLSEIRLKWNKESHQNIKTDSSVHYGVLASGAAVVEWPEILHKYIEPHVRKYKGVDMETYGVYYACREAFNPKPDFVSIKAVSDFADHEKGDDYQPYCSFLSAQFFYNLLIQGIWNDGYSN